MKTFLNKADFGSNNTDYSIDFSKYLNEYRIDSVVTKILNEYRYAIMHKAHPHFIPILMYHKVPDFPIETKHRIFVTKKKFEMHLKFFKFRRLTSITFKDYYAFSNGELPIKEFPKKPFILTFDDGYKDNYENALPLMQKYGFKGVLFLLGNFSVTGNFWDKGEDIETGKIMPLEQKKAFVDSGWEIGAHTLSHPDLNQLSLEKAFIEMMVSKRYIEKKLDTNVYSFAYPYGKYNDQIKLLTQKCDFKYGIATDTGGMTIEEDHFAIFRINMFPEENLIQLYKKTSKWYRKYYKKRRGK
jgi:peptidoglycan/xylan/chitin deacetylase (PgdA/CDA1 family)